MRNAILVALIITIIPFAQGNLGLNLSVQPQTVALNHGGIGQVNASLSSASTVCSLNCDYTLRRSGSTRAANIFEKNPSRPTDLGPIGVPAPPLTPSYGRSGTETYSLRVTCQENPACGEQSQQLQTPISVSYNLTQAKQRRYQNLSEKINEAKTVLRSAENGLDALEQRITAAPDNTILQPVQEDVNETREQIRSYRQKVQQAEEDKENLRYRFGLDAFKPGLLESMRNTNDSLQKYEGRFDQRIKRHNRTARALNEQIRRVQQYRDDSILAGAGNALKEATSALSAVRDLFVSGDYQAYQSVQQRVDDAADLTDNLINKTASKTTRLKQTSKTVLANEINETCSNHTACNLTTPGLSGGITDILPTTCEYLNTTLPTQYGEINGELTADYKQQVKQTRETNEEITAVNTELKSLRSVLRNITQITENNYIEVNMSSCRTAVNDVKDQEIPSNESIRSAVTTCNTTMRTMKKATTERKTMVEYLSYWITGLFTSHAVSLEEPGDVTQREAPPEPKNLSLNNKTVSFIAEHCARQAKGRKLSKVNYISLDLFS